MYLRVLCGSVKYMFARSYYLLLILLAVLTASTSQAQLTVSPGVTAATLAGKLAGPGITISSPTLTCATAANGTFTSVATPISIDSGIVLSSGRAVNTSGAESFLASTNNGMPGDVALATLAGTTTYDACILEFDFVPKGDTVSFNYQFGSEEYINSTCGQYNDAFAFFISGPGISGSQNMALVPGTSIPVTVNTINSGVPGPSGWPGYCNITNCTSMGPGSPFISYFVDNTGGTQVTYKGYTTRLKAEHEVIPCNTYHLKLTIADGANSLYDSGVFIEAGSLSTNAYHFKRTDSIGHTIAGIPNALVKGCDPAPITVLNSKVTGTPQTVYLSYGGTAVHGVDFGAPDSTIIAPGDTSVLFNITGLSGAPTGLQTIIIYLSSPYSCGIVDTLTLNLIDHPVANILTPDTAICLGKSFQVAVSGTFGLSYVWTPTSGVSVPTNMQPILAPTASTTYSMTATLPLSGCPPLSDMIAVTVNTVTLTLLTPDTTICRGEGLHIKVVPTPGMNYSWTPAASLDDATSNAPFARPTATTTYSVTATSTLGACPAFGNITITVVNPTVDITTASGNICPGATIHLNVTGDPTYLYSWLPGTGLDDATAMEPNASPEMATTYTVTATDPIYGCKATDKIVISIWPEVKAEAQSGRPVCLYEPISLEAFPLGNYSYDWNGPAGFSSGLQNPYIRTSNLTDGGTYIVVVTDNVSGCTGTATTNVIVGDRTNTLINVTPDVTIQYGSSLQLNAENAVNFRWTPNDGSLNNPNINNPIATPLETTLYTVYGVDTNGCTDTAYVKVTVTQETGVFIPTAFSPNADGLNDLFRVKAPIYYKLAEIRVFNRWGNQVYFSNSGDMKTGWDGTYMGQACEMGTYNYLIIMNKEGAYEQETYKGNVTLIR